MEVSSPTMGPESNSLDFRTLRWKRTEPMRLCVLSSTVQGPLSVRHCDFLGTDRESACFHNRWEWDSPSERVDGQGGVS